jgi:putative thioredoxin
MFSRLFTQQFPLFSSVHAASPSVSPFYSWQRSMATEAGNIVEVTKENVMQVFKGEPIGSAVSYKVTILDCYADWCGPCRLLTPVLEEAVNSYPEGEVRLAKLNVDNHGPIAQALKVSSIPAVFLIKDGKVENGFVGARSLEEVKSFIDDGLKP